MSNEDESCFPRVKLQKTTDERAIKRKEQINAELAKDSLFGREKDYRKKSLQKKSKTDQSNQKKVDDDEDVSELMKPKNVEYLSYKKVQIGSLILGMVISVDEFEFTVSLPFSMIGLVKAIDVFQAYTEELHKDSKSRGRIKAKSLRDFFHRGQLLVCKVKDVDVKKCFVSLTVDPKEVNSNLTRSSLKTDMMINGCITSEEDHGFVVDVGLPSVKAFLPKKMTDSKFGLEQWSNVRCVITNVKSNGSIIQLSNECKKISKAVEMGMVVLDHVQPGCVVKCTVVKTVEGQGQIVKFGSAHGSIALPSMCGKKNLTEDDESADDEEEGVKNTKKRKRKQRKEFSSDKYAACISYVSNDKLFCLTNKRAVWDDNKRIEHLRDLLDKYPIGEICEVKVTSHIKGIGIMCQLKESKEETGVVLMKNLFDKQDKLDEDKYKVANVVSARVLENMTLDGAVELACKKSVLASKVLSVDDLRPGDKLTTKILAVMPTGLKVLVGTKIDGEFRSNGLVRGFVPNQHLFDTVRKQPSKFFNEHDVIECRVLTTDPYYQRMRLTHKQTLLNLKSSDVISEYEQLRKGDLVQTFIDAFVGTGLLVRMFGRVRGLVPYSELDYEQGASCDMDQIKKDYYIGQVKKCRVINVYPKDEKLRLSFRWKKPTAQVEPTPRRSMQIFDVEVTEFDKDTLKVKVLPEDGKPLIATLPMLHLSDYQTIASVQFNKIKVGDKLENCAMLSDHRNTRVTMKKSLVDFIRNSEKPLCADDFTTGRMLPGYVCEKTDFGAFIRFPGGTTALCPKSKFTDRYISTTSRFFEIDQSVTVSVLEYNKDTNKLLVSHRPSDCRQEAGSGMSNLEVIEDYCNQMNACTDGMKLQLGSSVFVKIDEPYNEYSKLIRCSLADHRLVDDGYGTYLLKPSTPIEEEKLKAVVVDIGDDEILLAPSNFEEKKNKKALKLPSKPTATCRVILHNSDVIIGYVTTKGSSLKGAMVLLRRHTEDVIHQDEEIEVELLKIGPQSRYFLAERKTKKLLPNLMSRRIDPREIEIGTKVMAKIKSIRYTHAIVQVTSVPLTRQGKPVTGRIHFSQIDKGFRDGDFPLRKLGIVGEELGCAVTSHRLVKSHTHLEITRNDATNVVLELTTNENFQPLDDAVEPRDVKTRYPIGSEVQACVRDKLKSKAADPREIARFAVEVTTDVDAISSILLLSTGGGSTDETTVSQIKPGLLVTCYVTGHLNKNRITLVRKGAITGAGNGYEVVQGCQVNGKVCEIVNDGLLVKCPLGTRGKVSICDISDHFNEVSLEKFITKNSYIRCTVIDCSNTDRLILSMRQSTSSSSEESIDRHISDANQLKAGQKLRGFVKSYSKMGIFVILSRDVTGRVAFKNASKFYINDDNHQKVASEVFKTGRLVTCSVISVTPDGKVELSLLEKHTGVADCIPEEWGFPVRNFAGEKRKKSADQNGPGKQKRRKLAVDDESAANDVTNIIDDLKASAKVEEKTSKSPVIRQLDQSDVAHRQKEVIGFHFDDNNDVTMQNDDDDSSDDDDLEEVKRKTNKNDLKKKLEDKEAIVRQTEDRLLKEDNDEGGLETKGADELRRKIMADPHNSELWIQLIACHLHSAETDQARSVAEEALNKIEFSMVKHRFNVWMAWFNLEVNYGSDDTVKDLIKRALQHNDQLKVYKHVIKTYISRDDHEKAEDLYKQVVKKFRLNEDVWKSYIEYLTDQKRFDDAQAVLERSLQSIEKKSHIEFLKAFGRFCLKNGDSERGMNFFDKILAVQPRRGDVWSVYIDNLQSNGYFEEAGEAFAKVTAVSAKLKKSFFKRYLTFLEEHGTEAELNQKKLEFIDLMSKK